jgi:hypothetical protein
MQDMTHGKIAVFGGVYNNHLSLAATLADARARGATELYCLGDMGGFGPHPDRVFPLLRGADDLFVMQGNYDHSIGNRLEDCACGYTDPRDNHFAQISYDYTLANTSDDNKDWLRELPTHYRRSWGGRRVLCAHGSPRKVNEFLWESTSPDIFLAWLMDAYQADLLLVTHTGIPWTRTLPDGRQIVNVGAIGRPANNGRTSVDYVMVHIQPGELRIEPIQLPYDHHTLAQEMRDEQLPEEFVATILTGWWTTCLEILPARERSQGVF